MITFWRRWKCWFSLPPGIIRVFKVLEICRIMFDKSDCSHIFSTWSGDACCHFFPPCCKVRKSVEKNTKSKVGGFVRSQMIFPRKQQRWQHPENIPTSSIAKLFWSPIFGPKRRFLKFHPSHLQQGRFLGQQLMVLKGLVVSTMTRHPHTTKSKRLLLRVPRFALITLPGKLTF